MTETSLNSQNGEPANRNKTIRLTELERPSLMQYLRHLAQPVSATELSNCTIQQSIFDVFEFMPDHFVDLLFADPPYNLTKTYNKSTFSHQSMDEYERWLDTWIGQLPRLMKSNGSVYICGDWRSSAGIHRVLSKYFKVHNRITWEREKGRGAKANWKNNSEDIWFATVSDDFTFNLDDVKVKRQVIAPYTKANGAPKDWEKTEQGNFRETYPSNIWTDLTVPFWSMSENTDHPTQKPEKLLAKVILASSNVNELVFDPFLGSGTTSVVAKKLGRRYLGVEVDEDYCCLAEKRLKMADRNYQIQGYSDGIFWERNTLHKQRQSKGGQISALR